MFKIEVMLKYFSGIAAVILLWWFIVWIGWLSVLPSPVAVFFAFIELLKNGAIFIDILDSLRRVLVGFILAGLVGITLGLVLARYFKARPFIEPIVEILRPIPPIAWIPIAILLFGLGDNSAFFIVFLGAFFPIFTNTIQGALSIPVIYLNISKTLQISEWSFFKNILFKFSLPNIFTGLKIGMGMAWMCVIAAELIGAQSGLGAFIQMNRLLLNTENVIAGMIIIGIIGFLLISLFSIVEKRALVWRKVIEND